MKLTAEQQRKAEENMGLVGKVIQDCVHTLDKGCIYDYNDLFQIGCIGLCKAAGVSFQNVIPSQLTLTIPYIATVVALSVFGSKKLRKNGGKS